MCAIESYIFENCLTVEIMYAYKNYYYYFKYFILGNALTVPVSSVVGSVLFNDTLNTFNYGDMVSDMV